KVQGGGLRSTNAGLVLGTPEYMSPEQALGDSARVDARSDVYSLGATMFALLSGETVHTGASASERFLAVVSREPRSLASAAPHVHPALVAVVDRALRVEREQRWPDAREMQRELRLAYRAWAECAAAWAGAPGPTAQGAVDRTAIMPRPAAA